MKYSNPVVPGFYPDPSVCRVGSSYYLVNSSFEYFPGVPIFQSEDLVNWRQIGHCLTSESQLPLHGVGASEGIFAPTIRYHQGRFYMITTNITKGNFFVWADNPAGPWSEPIWLEQGGIDPSLLFDEDGRVFLTTSMADVQAIYQGEIDINTGKTLKEPQFLLYGTGGAYPESPHLYRIGEYYYLFMAEGGTEYGHMETVFRSRNPYGPFESCPHNPILTHRSIKSPIQALGHADIVQTEEGGWWAVFLGIRPVGYPPKYHIGRETFLAPVTWNEDGWPTIGDNGRVSLEMDGSDLPIGSSMEWKEIDDFNESSLGFDWNFLRNPNADMWSLQARPGALTLRGSEVTLNEAASPAFVGRRQRHLACEISTQLEFAPNIDGEEAGLSVYMNNRFHYEIALTRMDGVRKIILRRTIGSLWKVEQEIAYEQETVVLGIHATPTYYTFSFGNPGGEATVLGTGECSLLSTEVAGGFTGVYFAMYATGNGKRSLTEAHFDWFSYRPVTSK